MSRRYSVGVVTAYGAAKAGGYTGTYAQFCEDLADLGDNIAEVRQARTEVANNKTAAQEAQTGAETAQGAAEQAQSDAEAAAQSVSQSAAQISQNASDISNLKSAVKKKAPVIIDTASGAIVSFEDGADGMPLKSLTVNIEPVQSGSGDPSPENVRPITGWTGCTIVNSPTTDAQDGTTYPITFPSEAGTVYGGTLDAVSGVLSLTHSMVDLGTIEWTKGTLFFYSNNICKNQANKNVAADILCSALKPVSRNYLAETDKAVAINDAGAICVRNTAYSGASAEVFENAMSGIFLVYPLRNAVSYQLTPAEIVTLLGSNNIWADCGPISVDYPADTKLFIQKVNKPTDDDMIADARIESGKYFIIGNTLYLSTTLILAGETIIPGTNCQKTDLAAALNALNT